MANIYPFESSGQKKEGRLAPDELWWSDETDPKYMRILDQSESFATESLGQPFGDNEADDATVIRVNTQIREN